MCHFRVQYFFVLLLCACLCAFRAHYRLAFIAGIFALINVGLVVPSETVVHAKTSPEKGHSRNYRAALVNVSYDNEDHKKLLKYIREINPEFLVLLEITDLWMLKLEEIQDHFPYYQRHVHQKYGIILMSQIPIEESSILFLGDEDIPTVIAKFAPAKNERLTLIGAHPRSPVSSAHAKSRNKQLRSTAQLISEQSDPVVLLGDLNVTPWSPVFHDFLTYSGLHDSLKGIEFQPTWPTMFPFAWIPIDHCLISSEIMIHSRQVGPNVGSDHYPLVVDFSVRSENSELLMPANFSKVNFSRFKTKAEITI